MQRSLNQAIKSVRGLIVVLKVRRAERMAHKRIMKRLAEIEGRELPSNWSKFKLWLGVSKDGNKRNY